MYRNISYNVTPHIAGQKIFCSRKVLQIYDKLSADKIFMEVGHMRVQHSNNYASYGTCIHNTCNYTEVVPKVSHSGQTRMCSKSQEMCTC